MEKFVESFRGRINEINSENDTESGMEAAQVILILFLVVIGLIPVIVWIKNTLAARASAVNSGIPSN